MIDKYSLMDMITHLEGVKLDLNDSEHQEPGHCVIEGRALANLETAIESVRKVIELADEIP